MLTTSKQYYIFTKTWDFTGQQQTTKELKLRSKTMQEIWESKNLFITNKDMILHYNCISIKRGASSDGNLVHVSLCYTVYVKLYDLLDLIHCIPWETWGMG